MSQPADPVLPIRFGRAICGELEQAERREWWLANGTGAYAAGTIAGTLTRRYHGLLIAPVRPPLGRVLVMAKADASLQLIEPGTVAAPQSFPLFSNRWADGSVNPQGQLLESFELDGRMPVWRFHIEDCVVEMRIWMEHGAATSYLAYRFSGPAQTGASLRIALLANARDHHGNTRAGDSWYQSGFQVSAEVGRLRASHGSDFTLQVSGDARFTPEAVWYEHILLTQEQQRGLPDQDDHFCIGHAELQLQHDRWTGLTVSLEANADGDIVAAMQRFRDHDAALLARAGAPAEAAPPWVRRLIQAADSFVIARPLPQLPDGQSVIAGYPWFGDWGRDTMIALPGLALATGRFDVARHILLTFARFVDRGQLPNVFPGSGDEPQYNTVDAALWFIEAWRAYVQASGDVEALRQAWAALQDIVVWHLRGTRYGIAMDGADGLLRAGEAGVQLTWMDAKVGDWVVTPRIGKPVEINALWFNALSAMAELGERLGQPVIAYRALAQAARAGFQRFLNPANGGLYDVLDTPQGGPDDSVRPNQIFAVSLPYSPLDATAQAGVVALCGRELLTSYGLRTLSPRHRDYRPHYQGDVLSRDGSYHQGTVWPWLLGHFSLAQYRVSGDAAAALECLASLQDHLADAGLGTISEIFDGDAPHEPRGAPAQAWSVGCTLEAWWRLQQARPAASGNQPL